MITKIRQCCSGECNQGRWCEQRAYDHNKKQYFSFRDFAIIFAVIGILMIILL